MVEITSREEFEAWLKDKPADWAQVLAARAALRVLPHAFSRDFSIKMLNDLALTLTRNNLISWAARNLPAHDMRTSVAFSAAAAGSAAAPSFSADSAAAAATAAAAAFSAAAFSADSATYAAAAASFAAFSAAAVWRNVSQDCEWLMSQGDAKSATRILTSIKLWQRDAPEQWDRAWADASATLLSTDPSYQVWIDWYNRRIEGQDASFDIRGDTDRIEDKAILARLADATDDDFWGKGAVYVNTTLQGWIDDARVKVGLETIVQKLKGGALQKTGGIQEAESRAALSAKLIEALGNEASEHGGMGHNYPPEGIDPAEAPVLQDVERDEARQILAELEKPKPDALVIATTLSRWATIKGTFQHDEFSKKFSGELGTEAARLVGFVLKGLCSLGLIWLASLLTV